MPPKKDKLKQIIADNFSDGIPTSNNGMGLKTTEFYMEMLDKHRAELGKEKVTVWMQVGSFFEVYGFKWPDGRTKGNVWDVAADLDIKIARKQMLVYGDPEIEVYMAGVKEEYADPYLESLVDKNGWTVAIYVQEKQSASSDIARTLKSIISPGINFESDSISNIFMYIYCKGTSSRITTDRITLNIGVYFVDCISGANGVMELFTRDINEYSVVFSELIKLITIKNPAEMVIHCDFTSLISASTSNLQSRATQLSVLPKVFTSDNELIIALSLYDRNIKIRRDMPDTKYTNLDMQVAILNKVYSAYKSKHGILAELGIDGQYEYGRMTMCLALEYIFKHDANIIRLLERPEILQSSSQYLMLANNCLQQLDIIDPASRNRISQMSRDSEIMDSIATHTNTTRRKISVLDLLDKTKSVIGRRIFRQRLSIPITDPVILNSRYQQIDHLLNTQMTYMSGHNADMVLSPLNNLRTQLAMIKDIPKYMRKMATDKLLPCDLDTVIQSIKYIRELYTLVNKYGASWINSTPSDNKKQSLDTLFQTLNNTFQLTVCNNNWVNIETNIFKPSVCESADIINSDISLDRDFFNTLKRELNYKINSYISANTKTAAGKMAKPTEETDNIGEETNTKLGRYLYISDKIKEIMEKLSGGFIVGSYTINMSDISYDFIRKGRWQVKTNYLHISSKNMTDNIEKLRRLLKQEFSKWQSIFFETNHGLIADFCDFVAEVDVVQSCTYVAGKYGYVKPVIKAQSANRSYCQIKAIRHPIVEQIHQNTRYVTNDLSFGIDDQDGMLLFGINASGKSTTMKAIGCSIIMAQAGMYVPASAFTYWPYNYLFTRIRNNDDIYAGLSSFEVEMHEFKVILKYSDENSMILGDELCSGTETLDATAIVASGLQTLCRRHANFIFATHLHFLSEIPEITGLSNLKFYHLAVHTNPQDPGILIYDRELKPGNGPQSYGIIVCKSMNLDIDFLREAERIRLAIERGEILSGFSGRLTAASARIAGVELAPSGISKYNKAKIVDCCEICGGLGEDVHHIDNQCVADPLGIISNDKGTFHKNSKWNLVTLCKVCHLAVHGNSNDGRQLTISGYIQTSGGIKLNYTWETAVRETANISISSVDDANVIVSTSDQIKEFIRAKKQEGRTARSIQHAVKRDFSGHTITLRDISDI